MLLSEKQRLLVLIVFLLLTVNLGLNDSVEKSLGLKTFTERLYLNEHLRMEFLRKEGGTNTYVEPEWFSAMIGDVLCSCKALSLMQRY